MHAGPSSTFDEDYFSRVYRSAYHKRNPPYKHRSYLREVRRVARGHVLLDVGCAYGSFLKEAVKQFTCSGCDVSAHAVEVAAGRVPAAGIWQASLFDLRSGAGYDVITCFDVLEHIEEVDSALIHLRSLLRPAGALVVTMPVYDTMVGRLVDRLDKDPTHVHKLSRYEWVRRVEAAGFQVIAWKGIMRYYFGGPFYLHWCAQSIRRYSPAILITARVAQADEGQ